MKKGVALVILLLFPAVLYYAATAALDDQVIACPYSVVTESFTRLQASDPSGIHYNEISGLALSPTQQAPSGEPVLYGVNDFGGGGKRLGVFDSGTGERLLTLSLSAFLPAIGDFESMAIGSCGGSSSSSGLLQDTTCIYIADVGDNKARNTYPLGQTSGRNGTPYQIFKIREPILANFMDGDEIPASDFFILPFNYSHATSPTTYADCEAVFLDHVGWGGEIGDFYFVTKWDAGDAARNRLFRIPASVWPSFSTTAAAAAEVVAPMYSPVAVGYSPASLRTAWTRADMTLDGTVIAMGDYQNTYLFLRCPGVSVVEALETQFCHSWANPRSWDARQFETFAWAPNGTKTLQMSECDSGCNPRMSWTTMEYNDTSAENAVCPQVEWSPAAPALDDDDGSWYCRTIEDNSIKPDAWCEDRNLDRPTTPPSLSPAAGAVESTPGPMSPESSSPTDNDGTTDSSASNPLQSSTGTTGTDAPPPTSGSDTSGMIGSLQQLPLFLLSSLFLM